jgi:hypothetical protein
MHCVGQRGLRIYVVLEGSAHKSVLTSVTTTLGMNMSSASPSMSIVFPQRQSDRPPTPRCEAIEYSYKQNALDKSSKLTMKGIE